MLFLTQSAAVYGIDALIVDIEVNLQPVKGEIDNAPPVLIVGLPDTAIRESRERIRAAITNSSFFFPFHKTTINLAPADVRKEGASFDLPIALGILGANGDLGNGDGLENTLSVGELSLDGRVRPVRGALSIALRCRENGIKNLLIPEENATEAAVVKEVDVYVDFHSSMKAEQVLIIVKNAGNGQVVKTFFQPGEYKLPFGAYTFTVSGNTKLYSKNDLTKNSHRLEDTGRIQSPCESITHDGGIQKIGRAHV